MLVAPGGGGGHAPAPPTPQMSGFNHSFAMASPTNGAGDSGVHPALSAPQFGGGPSAPATVPNVSIQMPNMMNANPNAPGPGAGFSAEPSGPVGGSLNDTADGMVGQLPMGTGGVPNFNTIGSPFSDANKDMQKLI